MELYHIGNRVYLLGGEKGIYYIGIFLRERERHIIFPYSLLASSMHMWSFSQ